MRVTREFWWGEPVTLMLTRMDADDVPEAIRPLVGQHLDRALHTVAEQWVMGMNAGQKRYQAIYRIDTRLVFVDMSVLERRLEKLRDRWVIDAKTAAIAYVRSDHD